MTLNVGKTDRLIRFALGVALILAPFLSNLALFASPLFFYGALVVGCVMLVVSATGFCPLYSLFGFKTCRA
ncbi:DUF2892 domain-containing protein [Pseudovibrio sp. SPO723]|uniref:YgaP family membrane protein n=1 Tax=Nesiotobacter zosterae TaxID=392721 RepID=UPI0029C247A4|nr:DUF2892 domain-containing protein [Pseudovibrio sp. SPO723]MDX5593346.1 DUF2892 domain-containing protein [Pseudovibrio sp. SPO723]